MNIYTDNNSYELYKNIDFTITSDLIPVDSINSPITSERITEQINKLGGTPFEFDKIDVDLDDNLYVPSISKLNQLRRNCMAKLEEILLDRIHRATELDTSSFDVERTENEDVPDKDFSILLSKLNPDFNYTNIDNVDRIYIPLKFFMSPEYSSKINEITEVAPTYIYMPSIMKDSVIHNFNSSIDDILKRFAIKGFVISNISHLHLLTKYTSKYEIIANYTMNIYNNATIDELKKLGINTVTLSPELVKRQNEYGI